MAFALLFALALAGAEPASPSNADQPIAASVPHEPAAAPAVDPKPMTEAQMEDAVPDGAPKDDYGLVAWCHGALSGQIELDPIVEKDMDAIEGKAKAAERKASDAAIAKEHRRYMTLYEKALLAAERASPVAIHQKGVDAELQGYKIWGPTRNKPPIWRMVDWGNWEVPPVCEKAAKRLYDHASLFGEALKPETAAPAAPEPSPPADPSKATAVADGLRGPQ
jgi:hypothetical protein